MNLHFPGSSIDPNHNELSEPAEQMEGVVYPNLVESLDEGGEYADDALRMTDQPFGQD